MYMNYLGNMHEHGYKYIYVTCMITLMLFTCLLSFRFSQVFVLEIVHFYMHVHLRTHVNGFLPPSAGHCFIMCINLSVCNVKESMFMQTALSNPINQEHIHAVLFIRVHKLYNPTEALSQKLKVQTKIGNVMVFSIYKIVTLTSN